MLKRLYHWMGTQAQTPYAEGLLAICSFLESLIFPPVAPLFILCCLENRKKSYWFACIATVCSVLGGIVAFYIGAMMWATVGKQLVAWVASPESFASLVQQYTKYQALVVLIGAFAPVPYRLIGLTAGFCQLSVISFTLCSLLARAGRYFLLAAAINRWGNEMKQIIDRWFYQLVVTFVALVGIGLYGIRQ
jgi:membrane protein YqaA with SNARE-associated domain